MNDEYKTIDDIGQGVYTEKRSKFLAYAHPVNSIEQIKDLLANYRKQTYNNNFPKAIMFDYKSKGDFSSRILGRVTFSFGFSQLISP